MSIIIEPVAANFILSSTRTKSLLCIITAVFLFSLVDVIVKYLIDDFPVNQILFFRMLFGLLPALIMIHRENLYSHLCRTEYLPHHILRAATAIGGMGLFFYALSLLPLAEAVALSFTETLFLVILAIPLLGEPANTRRIIAAVVGFSGVLLIVQPSSDVSNAFGIMVVTVSSILFALSMITVCMLGRSESTSVIVFFYTAIGTVVTGCSTIFYSSSIDGRSLLLFAALGLIGGIGQLLMTNAYRLEKTNVVAPFHYTSLIWSAFFGYMIWSETLSLLTIFGIAIITGSSIYAGQSTDPRNTTGNRPKSATRKPRTESIHV